MLKRPESECVGEENGRDGVGAAEPLVLSAGERFGGRSTRLYSSGFHLISGSLLCAGVVMV